jgi:large subunit ribosomal protein L6
MSRIGRKPIPVPKGVQVTVHPDAVEVKGPKGTLQQRVPPGVTFEMSGADLVAATIPGDPSVRKFHGLARSLVANAVRGVTEGFKKELDIVGVGYRAEVKGKQVVFALGYSHPIVYDVPAGVDVAVDKQTHVTVSGIDRQLVARSPRTSAGCASRIRTSRRACATRVKS